MIQHLLKNHEQKATFNGITSAGSWLLLTYGASAIGTRGNMLLIH